MNSSLLCRVQALYPFSSNDPSSLRFSQGDCIDVLAKLPSGWWDGWCNGNRGWFPSNYVEVIEEYGDTKKRSTQIDKSGMIDLFDDRIEEGHTNDCNIVTLPVNWTIRSNESGTSVYYYNYVTGEVRSTYPYEDNNSEDESDEEACLIFTEHIPRSDSIVEVHELKSTDEMDPILKEMPSAKWIQCTTAEGIPFYYNISTQETTPFTDQEYHHGLSNYQSKLPHRSSKLLVADVSQLPTEDKMTWHKLLLHITLAINNVISSVKNNRQSLYKHNVSLVVDAVRYLLISTGTIDKNLIEFKTSAALRSHHRTMMASLSKLVLSAHLCSDNTSADIAKLLSDCHELLASVRNFITTCESKQLEIRLVNPTLMNPKNDRDSRRISSISTESCTDHPVHARYELQSDLIESLDAYGESMKESMDLLINNLTRNSDSRCSLAVLLFTQYRNFVNQNSQFMSIIDDIDFQDVKHSVTMKHLRHSKQLLYDGLGILFYKMQGMTVDSIPMDSVISDMQKAAQSIIQAITSACGSITTLVEERRALCTDRTDIISDSGYGHGDLSPEFKHHSMVELTDTLSSEYLKSATTTDTESELSRAMSHLSTRRSKRLSSSLSERSHSIDSSSFTPLKEVPVSHTNTKLKHFFGDDIPIQSNNSVTSSYLIPTNKKSREDEQRYLRYDYDPNEIVFTAEGTVKGGTLKALVERMTLHDYLDMNFNNTFLLTYRSFCTSFELLELLEARYNLQPPDDLTPTDLEIWTTKKQKLVRLRVFNVLKIWLEQYYYEEDSVILDRLLEFTRTSIKSTLSFSALHLEQLIQKRKESRTDVKRMVMTQQQGSPESILPRNLKMFRLLEVDVVEMARQLTLMDFKLYTSIKPIECLDKAWSRDGCGKNIKASIEYCNQVTTWVSDSILSETDVKKRSSLIKYWVNVADKCRLFNNFNTCMAILSAFDNSAIGRLKRTWELVGARTKHIASHIRQIMGAKRNFNQYRVLIHSINPPCIPFLGIYLQDLTFIEDGNANHLKTSKALINFSKRAKTAEVIREIQQYQSMGYSFKPVEEIQSFIWEQLRNARDEDQLYNESLKLEPKEREDEKIARLLQESGFL